MSEVDFWNLHPVQFNALVKRRNEVIQQMQWPIAVFGSIYCNAHLKEGATPISPSMFIPGMAESVEVRSTLLEDQPFDEIAAGFRAYDTAWHRANPEEVEKN